MFFSFLTLFLELFRHFLHVCSLCVSKFPCVPKGIRKRKSIQITGETSRLRHLRCAAMTFKSYLFWFHSSSGPRNEELKDRRNSTLHRTMFDTLCQTPATFLNQDGFQHDFQLTSAQTKHRHVHSFFRLKSLDEYTFLYVHGV